MNWSSGPFWQWWVEQLDQVAAQAHLASWEQRASTAETERDRWRWKKQKVLNRIQQQQEKLQRRGLSWRDIGRLKQLTGIDATEDVP